MDPFYSDVPELFGQHELTYNSSVGTEDVVQKTCHKQWMIGTNSESESGKSVLAAWLMMMVVFLE